MNLNDDPLLPPKKDDLPPDDSIPFDSPPEIAPEPADLKFTRRRRRPAGDRFLETAERLPPAAFESEQGILGCIMLSPNEAIGECMSKLTEAGEEFYDLRHQTIYKALVRMYDRRESIDVITLMQTLTNERKLEEIGGVTYLTSLSDLVPSAANLDFYLKIVIEKFQLRRVIRIATEGIQNVYEAEGEVEQIIDNFEKDVLSIRSAKVSTSSGMKELVPQAQNLIESMMSVTGRLSGIATGYADLDRMTNGLQPGEMIVIAARPSLGKTSLAMNIVENVAVKTGIPCGVFSMEMTKLALTTRMISSLARVNLRNVREGFVAQADVPRLSSASQNLYGSPIEIDDTPALPIMQLRARARVMAQRFGIKLLVIDYLQLAQSTTRRGKENRQIEVSEISCGIKALAKELNIPVIVLSQLNRDIERDKKRKPNLSDLRESGSIEQDADVVAFLYKPAYDDDDAAEQSDALPINLLVAKQRNGPTGDVPLTFIKGYTRFESAAKVSDDDEPAESEQAKML